MKLIVCSSLLAWFITSTYLDLRCAGIICALALIPVEVRVFVPHRRKLCAFSSHIPGSSHRLEGPATILHLAKSHTVQDSGQWLPPPGSLQ